jgi:hypothetical protein
MPRAGSHWQSVCIWLRSVFVIYQDPLAYLLGLEGIALLDAWAGDLSAGAG